MLQNKITYHTRDVFNRNTIRYKNILYKLQIVPSMSRGGNPLDNVLVENFFSILKTESIYREKILDFNHVQQLIDEFIEYYNDYRIQLKSKQTPFQKRCLFS